MTRRAATIAALSLLGSLVLLPLLGATPAHAAKTITISLTADGPKPASLTAAIGDSIVFVNDDATFIHQVGNGNGPWADEWQSPPLAPGGQYTVPVKLTKAGTHLYEGRNLDDFTGRILVPAAATSPKPAASRTSAPAPSRSAAPGATASPSPTGAAGAVGPPPLAGGFGTIGAPSPSPGAAGPAPAVAPTLAGEELPSPVPSGETVAISNGRLPEPPTARKYGLPAALAAIAAVGVASLLVRLLLAHPAARRAKHAAGRGDLTVTVD